MLLLESLLVCFSRSLSSTLSNMIRECQLYSAQARGMISPLGPVCAVQPVKSISCKGVKLSRLRDFSWFKLDGHVILCLKMLEQVPGSCLFTAWTAQGPPNYSSYTCIEATCLFLSKGQQSERHPGPVMASGSAGALWLID